MSSRYIPLEQAMDQIVRRRRGESAWREIVARQEESGLTVPEFCEREDLKAASLYGWRVRLRREPAGKIASPRVVRKSPVQKASQEFIDLGAIDSSRGRFEVRLHLVRG